MQTENLSLELMVPNQINKDQTFNEAMLKLDQFCHMSINNELSSEDIDNENLVDVGKKYLIINGEHQNKICYRPSESKPNMFHKPIDGMVMFNQARNYFMHYQQDEWKQCGDSNNEEREALSKNFTEIYDQYALPVNLPTHYLYMTGDVEISLDNNNMQSLTLIIKQAYDNNYNLTWPCNILWNNGESQTLCPERNSMLIVQIFKLPDSDHFLGILNQNYNY